MREIPADVIDRFWADQAQKSHARQQFFESNTCKLMIEQILCSGQELDVEDIHYDLDGIRRRYGWDRSLYSKEDIELFCETMIDTANAVDSFVCQLDADNPFDHSYHLKGGLIVFSMHGQGSVYVIIPPNKRPDILAQLQAEKVEPAVD